MVAQSADEAPKWNSKYCPCKGCETSREEGRQEILPKLNSCKIELNRMQQANEFVKNNTLEQVISALYYIQSAGGTLDHAIERVRCMKK